MVWPVKTHPAQSTGPEGKKNSGDGENFSLDFSFYRTSTVTPFHSHIHPADSRLCTCSRQITHYKKGVELGSLSEPISKQPDQISASGHAVHPPTHDP